MASPEPSSYHHHHQHVYSHQNHQPQQPPPPPPPPLQLGLPPPSSAPPHQGLPGHEVYSDRPVHYPDHHQTLPHHHAEVVEQPLDLSLSRSPRPPSTGIEGRGKRPRLEESSRDSNSSMDMGRPGHSNSVCMMRGCSCHSPMPVHHQPHHYSRHRHSPYPQPQYPPSLSGHSSPAMGEMQTYPHSYSIPQPPPPSTSPGMMYGSGSSSPYIPPPPPQERRSRSPGMVVSPYGSDLAPQRPSPGALLCPPLHSSVSPLSISPHAGRDASPCPPSQSLARLRGVSPRPFYRPFEDVGHPLADMPHATPVISSSSRMSAMEPYPSEDDLSASSTLLMLSNTTSESSSSGSSVPSRQTADSSMENFGRREENLSVEESTQVHLEPTQSDSGRPEAYHQLPSHPPPSSHFSQATSAGSNQQCSSEVRTQVYTSSDSPPLGPAQDGTVASSYSSDDLNDSPKQDEKKTKTLKSRLMKVVGTTPLAALREERAKQQAVKKGKMKELLARHSERYSSNSNDSEGASDLNSTGQASPRSSDGSENDVGQGFPIPPDPNLKMSALDYLISKVLVERIDVPFKACNTEIKEIYTGAKKGRLTLVDLIELQVEASLKA